MEDFNPVDDLDLRHRIQALVSLKKSLKREPGDRINDLNCAFFADRTEAIEYEYPAVRGGT